MSKSNPEHHPNLNPLPSDPSTYLSHSILESGESPNKSFKVEFQYTDCIRTFDGRVWTVEPRT